MPYAFHITFASLRLTIYLFQEDSISANEDCHIQAENKLAVAQRNLSRKKKGSSSRLKAKIKVAKLHQKIQNHRDEFLHQVSRKIVDSADLIVFENLNIQGMLKNHHLAKHIQDHAWGKLIQFTQSKAAKAGKMVELVEARYTSQKCSQCGMMVPKTLADRVHLCPNCGLELDRDINASINIRTLGLRGSAYKDPTPTLNKTSKQVRSMT